MVTAIFSFWDVANVVKWSNVLQRKLNIKRENKNFMKIICYKQGIFLNLQNMARILLFIIYKYICCAAAAN